MTQQEALEWEIRFVADIEKEVCGLYGRDLRLHHEARPIYPESVRQWRNGAEHSIAATAGHLGLSVSTTSDVDHEALSGSEDPPTS